MFPAASLTSLAFDRLGQREVGIVEIDKPAEILGIDVTDQRNVGRDMPCDFPRKLVRGHPGSRHRVDRLVGRKLRDG